MTQRISKPERILPPWQVRGPEPFTPGRPPTDAGGVPAGGLRRNYACGGREH
jgi:hypothetical protein